MQSAICDMIAPTLHLGASWRSILCILDSPHTQALSISMVHSQQRVSTLQDTFLLFPRQFELEPLIEAHIKLWRGFYIDHRLDLVRRWCSYMYLQVSMQPSRRTKQNTSTEKGTNLVGLYPRKIKTPWHDIHVSYLSLVLSKSDWASVIPRVFSLLGAGGFTWVSIGTHIVAR